MHANITIHIHTHTHTKRIHIHSATSSTTSPRTTSRQCVWTTVNANSSLEILTALYRCTTISTVGARANQLLNSPHACNTPIHECNTYSCPTPRLDRCRRADEARHTAPREGHRGVCIVTQPRKRTRSLASAPTVTPLL